MLSASTNNARMAGLQGKWCALQMVCFDTRLVVDFRVRDGVEHQVHGRNAQHGAVCQSRRITSRSSGNILPARCSVLTQTAPCCAFRPWLMLTHHGQDRLGRRVDKNHCNRIHHCRCKLRRSGTVRCRGAAYAQTELGSVALPADAFKAGERTPASLRGRRYDRFGKRAIDDWSPASSHSIDEPTTWTLSITGLPNIIAVPPTLGAGNVFTPTSCKRNCRQCDRRQ